MNKKLWFSIWYVILAIWAVILVHDFIHALQQSKNALQRVQDVGRRGEHCRGVCRQPDIDRKGEVMGGAELKAIMD